MATFRCKMCGAPLMIAPGQTTCECESCFSVQTLPRIDDDRRANLYDRANHYRRGNEFDKAAGIYEQILDEDKTDAEAYWSLVLCRYGVEYVEDAASHKRIPTLNRVQYTSVFDDENYKQALAYADISQKLLYEQEAKTLNEIQKGILAISQKEDPFDIFICYKETDDNGRRTQDSVLAYDLYQHLTREGYKVFFSRVTLEDKIGTAYEPYIFAALNSAKVMIVLGTKAEYFNAVWVKNEWGRYLALVKNSGGKKFLIPAYRDMDPYDLPEEFSHLQAQDMGKLGFMQDLTRGIKKLLEADKPKEKETVIIQQIQGDQPQPPQVSDKLRRMNGPNLIRTMFLVGASGPSDVFPNNQYSNYVDIGKYTHLAMQMQLFRPIGYTGTATYNYKIFDNMNNVVLDETRDIAVIPTYDKFSLVWILVGDDGSRVSPGQYRLETWIDNSRVFEYNFTVIDSTAQYRSNNNTSSSDLIQSLLAERRQLEMELSSTTGIFAGRRRREIQSRIDQINTHLRTLI